MNTQQNIQILRVQLLAMARLSQRALDESVKGYELRNLDFARHVGKAENDLQEHYRRIKDLRRQIMNCGNTNASDCRFTSAASSIATALHGTNSAAKQIAQSTMQLLESSGIEDCAQLEQLAQGVNRSMRLCVIALFNEDARLARTALRSQEHSVQLYELGVSDFSSVGPQNDFERTVIRELGAIAEQVQEIADALLSWLEGKHMSASEFIRDFGSSSRQVPSAHAGSDTTLYMQSRQNLRPKASQSLLC